MGFHVLSAAPQPVGVFVVGFKARFFGLSGGETTMGSSLGSGFGGSGIVPLLGGSGASGVTGSSRFLTPSLIGFRFSGVASTCAVFFSELLSGDLDCITQTVVPIATTTASKPMSTPAHRLRGRPGGPTLSPSPERLAGHAV